ncbi:teratocarcinoma-derived growth factor 1 isoform X1 [Pseudoliparis swirei]|uniref:teratocarcinoma-derived growth factor 1 isoform X1 n=1 Tax=Pseudoliparis swirei TaxID=2059687 RepID=UPI0024BEC2DD|nr:teratocarcinoma-derived growth factor 1 isoform X1 [Pseudoliparis swirei]
MRWTQLIRMLLSAATGLHSAAGCEGDDCSLGQTSSSSSSSSSQDFLGQLTQVPIRVAAAVRTEEPASWGASAPACRSSPGGAASTTSASGAVAPSLTVSGSRRDAPTVAVATESCTASPTSSTRTATPPRRFCGTARQRGGPAGPGASWFWFSSCPSSSDGLTHRRILETSTRTHVDHWAVDRFQTLD